MLRELQAELVDHGILLRIFVLADRCAICFDADGIEDEVGRLDRTMTLDGLLCCQSSGLTYQYAGPRRDIFPELREA